MSARHAERADDRHGHDEDKDIQRRVPPGMRVPECRRVDAMAARMSPVPVILDRGALEDGRESEHDHGGNHGGVDDVTQLLKPGYDKDLEVQEEKGHFGQRDQDLVWNLIHVEVLLSSTLR